MTKPPLSLYRELIAAGEKALWIHSSGVIHVQEHNTVLSWNDCLEIVTSVHHQQGSLLLIFKLQWYNWLRGSTVGGFYQDSEKGTCSGRAFSLSFHLPSRWFLPRAGECGMSLCLHHLPPQPHFPPFVTSQISCSLSNSQRQMYSVVADFFSANRNTRGG